MTSNNVIFLDVDGVLNTTSDQSKMLKMGKYFVQPKLVDNLARIVKKTDARIVLSSTWRFHDDMVDYLKEQIFVGLRRCHYSNFGRVESFEAAPLELYNDVIIGLTPDLAHPRFEEMPADSTIHTTRTDEIILWLKENVELDLGVTLQKTAVQHNRKYAKDGDIQEHEWLLTKKMIIKNFVCLDDIKLSSMSCYGNKSRIGEHQVQTRKEVGLTKEDANEAIEILSFPFDVNEWASKTLVQCEKINCFHQKKSEELAKLKILESMVKRSSLNVALEIPVFKRPPTERSKTEPEQELKKTASKQHDKKNSAPPSFKRPEDDGYNFVL